MSKKSDDNNKELEEIDKKIDKLVDAFVQGQYEKDTVHNEQFPHGIDYYKKSYSVAVEKFCDECSTMIKDMLKSDPDLNSKDLKKIEEGLKSMKPELELNISKMRKTSLNASESEKKLPLKVSIYKTLSNTFNKIGEIVGNSKIKNLMNSLSNKFKSKATPIEERYVNVTTEQKKMLSEHVKKEVREALQDVGKWHSKSVKNHETELETQRQKLSTGPVSIENFRIQTANASSNKGKNSSNKGKNSRIR